MRGREPRIHRNIIAIERVLIEVKRSERINDSILLKKKTEVNSDIIMILAYSAINNRAKVPLLNSVLKPETNSDSPSAKSNGVRFVSASVVVNQQMNNMGNIIIGE